MLMKAHILSAWAIFKGAEESRADRARAFTLGQGTTWRTIRDRGEPSTGAGSLTK